MIEALLILALSGVIITHLITTAQLRRDNTDLREKLNRLTDRDAKGRFKK